MIDYEPQNLRYTDDVIATLQSGLPVREIARALQITEGEAQWHIEETVGIPHNGTVIWPKHRAHVPRFPTCPEWYKGMTAWEAARALKCGYETIREFCRVRGIELRGRGSVVE